MINKVNYIKINQQGGTLSAKDIQYWNNFIDYVHSKGYRGNPELDVRAKGISKTLYNDFAKINNFTRPYEEYIPEVQKALLANRTDLINAARAGKSVIPGVDYFNRDKPIDVGDEELERTFMPGMSTIDGWAGSKTTTYKLPARLEPELRISSNYNSDMLKQRKAMLKQNGGKLINMYQKGGSTKKITRSTSSEQLEYVPVTQISYERPVAPTLTLPTIASEEEYSPVEFLAPDAQLDYNTPVEYLKSVGVNVPEISVPSVLNIQTNRLNQTSVPVRPTVRQVASIRKPVAKKTTSNVAINDRISQAIASAPTEKVTPKQIASKPKVSLPTKDSIVQRVAKPIQDTVSIDTMRNIRPTVDDTSSVKPVERSLLGLEHGKFNQMPLDFIPQVERPYHVSEGQPTDTVKNKSNVPVRNSVDWIPQVNQFDYLRNGKPAQKETPVKKQTPTKSNSRTIKVDNDSLLDKLMKRVVSSYSEPIVHKGPAVNYIKGNGSDLASWSRWLP